MGVVDVAVWGIGFGRRVGLDGWEGNTRVESQGGRCCKLSLDSELGGDGCSKKMRG